MGGASRDILIGSDGHLLLAMTDQTNCSPKSAAGKTTGKKVKLTIANAGKEVTLPVLEATEGADIIDIRTIYKETGYFMFDPGFVSTASCESKITYINGAKGELKYRGYPVEQLAQHSNFEEVCYLILYGELPGQSQLNDFRRSLREHAALDQTAIGHLLNAFDRSHHPMAMLMAGLAYLAALYQNEIDVHDEAYRRLTAHRIVAKVATLVAWIFRHRCGKKFKQPDPGLPYAHNFLQMCFDDLDQNPRRREKFVKAMDLILVLHADHEQNASTSTVRLSGSTETSPYAALVAGITSLWGPAHGGANQAVIEMLDSIVNSGKPLEHYIKRAKDRKDHFKLMGFGHRIYKNYDPRAKIVRETCHNLLQEMEAGNPDQALLETAISLEKIALEDEYFIKRKLYPNVDFYSGIIFKTMKLPSDMFTAIFALSRAVGWISHWNEMMSDKHTRIGRPRQLYVGSQERNYVPLGRR